MSDLKLEIVREYLTPQNDFSIDDNVLPFWRMAYACADYPSLYELPDFKEIGLMQTMLRQPIIKKLNWFHHNHNDDDGGTWVGSTSNDLNEYSVWQKNNEGVMATIFAKKRIYIGSTNEEAKKLAEVHNVMSTWSRLSDDFIMDSLIRISNMEGVNI